MCVPNLSVVNNDHVHNILFHQILCCFLSLNVLYTLITVLLELEIELKHILYNIILLRENFFKQMYLFMTDRCINPHHPADNLQK